MKSYALAAMSLAGFVALTCGGTVETRGSGATGGTGAQTGTGGGGGSAAGGTGGISTGGTGAVPAGGGGMPAGGGGMPAGGGGMPAGGGGMPAGGGGMPAGGGGMPTGGAGGNPNCPPAPSCNWCGGEMQLDAQGCFVRYVCPNGIDPCQTPPCQTTGDCAAGEVCDPIGLCWSPDPSCTTQTCAGTNDACNCNWSCTDNNAYETHCKFTGAEKQCDCFVNYQIVTSCVMGAAGASCEEAYCCGFPN